MKKSILFTALACVALSGCDTRPEHAEYQPQCVESHAETSTVLMPMLVGKVTVLMPQTQIHTVCDKEENVCVAGRDGSTECEGNK